MASTGRVTVYMDEADIADLDDIRVLMRRRLGKPIDRGRLVRAAVTVARNNMEAWADQVDEEG